VCGCGTGCGMLGRLGNRSGGRVGMSLKIGLTSRDLVFRNDALFNQKPRAPVEPALIVARSKIVGRRHSLNGVTALVDIANPGVRHGATNCIDDPLPRRMENRLILLANNLAEALHSTQVVHAVQRAGILLSLVDASSTWPPSGKPAVRIRS